MKLAACFSILILLANLLCIKFLGTDVPFWDQWDSEAQLYIKWIEKTLTLGDIIKPHVQHRFAVSRVLRILLFEASGGWSPIRNMIFQSLFVPFIFLIFFSFLRERIRVTWRKTLFYAISGLIFIFPLYWEAILLGFQSHIYLSIIFALLIIKLSATSPRLSSLIWFTTIGFTNSFTSASSLIPLIVSLIVQLISLIGFKQWKSRLAFGMIGMNLLLIILNVFLMVSPENHKQYGAQGAWDLIYLSLEAFSWPVEYLGIISIWIIPLVIAVSAHKAWTIRGLKNLTACVCRDRSNLAIFAFLLWLMLSVVSIAYARGNYALFVSRYMNIYGFTLFVPFLLYLLFFDGVLRINIGRLFSRVLIVLYFLVLIGLVKEMTQEMQRCLKYKKDMDVIKKNLITAIQKESPDYLYEQKKLNYTYGAHPNPGMVYEIMNHSSLRAKLLWLPKELRYHPPSEK